MLCSGEEDEGERRGLRGPGGPGGPRRGETGVGRDSLDLEN